MNFEYNILKSEVNRQNNGLSLEEAIYKEKVDEETTEEENQGK
ncbi:MAG: hypothetical protein UV78_C0072G0005 [Parcubacteria group bacterium GW2011_GWA2_43_17]|nr:MAG: hypothetical protein UV78_C0072G0005 [Parcubacteria group bacterium GW2011_GWA2_43_17]